MVIYGSQALAALQGLLLELDKSAEDCNAAAKLLDERFKAHRSTQRRVREQGAKLLRTIRVNLGMTQEDLARLLGLTKSWLCNLELGHRLPTAELLADLVALRPTLLKGR